MGDSGEEGRSVFSSGAERRSVDSSSVDSVSRARNVFSEVKCGVECARGWAAGAGVVAWAGVVITLRQKPCGDGDRIGCPASAVVFVGVEAYRRWERMRGG